MNTMPKLQEIVPPKEKATNAPASKPINPYNPFYIALKDFQAAKRG